jgi:hypothetical protein
LIGETKKVNNKKVYAFFKKKKKSKKAVKKQRHNDLLDLVQVAQNGGLYSWSFSG